MPGAGSAGRMGAGRPPDEPGEGGAAAAGCGCRRISSRLTRSLLIRCGKNEYLISHEKGGGLKAGGGGRETMLILISLFSPQEKREQRSSRLNYYESLSAER